VTWYFSKKQQQQQSCERERQAMRDTVNALQLLFMDLKAALEGYDNNYDSQIYYRL